eukprot:scaffold77482_cov27-Tisochrysis_lutea.AAC.2
MLEHVSRSSSRSSVSSNSCRGALKSGGTRIAVRSFESVCKSSDAWKRSEASEAHVASVELSDDGWSTPVLDKIDPSPLLPMSAPLASTAPLDAPWISSLGLRRPLLPVAEAGAETTLPLSAAVVSGGRSNATATAA